MLPDFLAQQTRVSVDLMLVDRPVRLADEGIDVALRIGSLEDKKFQIMWIGAKYAATENLDVIGAYYHYIQNFLRHRRRGARPLLRHRTPAMRRDVRRDL